jgi:serine/threonine protein kinase
MRGACPDANTIGQLAEGSLDESSRRELLAHIDACAECRRLVALAADARATSPSADGADTPLRPGARLGAYVIVRALGAGAMGVVYAARDERLDRVVALKVTRPSDRSEELRSRVLREGKAAAALSHPNVVIVHEVGGIDGYLFIAMELVEGGTLADWLATRKREAGSVIEMFRQAGAGLATAHDVGIVHRDFKPDNVLIGLDGRPRVADFGLARAPSGGLGPSSNGEAAGAAWHTIAGPGILVGTLAYMAPEQLRAEPADARSDQYAFALSLVEALLGEALDQSADAASAIARARRRHGALVPPRVWEALARALSGEPAARFPDMHALLRALGNAEPREIGAQLVDELWVRARTSLPAFLLIALLAWPLIRSPAKESTATAVAYVSALGVGVARWVAALLLARRPGVLSAATRYHVMLGSALANGIALGVLDVLLYPRLGPLDLGLWITFIAGIAGGATVSLGARPEVFLAFAVPALGAFIAASVLWPRDGIAAVPIAVAIWILYSLSQVIQYRASRRQFIQLNTELDKNLRRLHAANEQLARKNVELVEMGRRADRIFSALGDTLPGRTLAGKYRLEARIGTGGFAIVFRGTHTELGRPVAVKIFRPQAGNDSAASLERFRHEGLTSSRVRHPNIVDVIDAGMAEDGIPYIAMELLDGRTLDAELDGGRRLPLARIAAIAHPICLGLAAAHAAGVVHRDIKPENIFLHGERGFEVVKLLDFGIAKVADTDRLARAQLTSTGDLVGSPHYMAPERLLGEDCDASADVYSVGVILFKALAGRLPFEGTLGEVVRRAVSGPPDDIRTLVPGLPADTADGIMRALAHEPGKRPTAAELAAALARVKA